MRYSTDEFPTPGLCPTKDSPKMAKGGGRANNTLPAHNPTSNKGDVSGKHPQRPPRPKFLPARVWLRPNAWCLANSVCQTKATATTSWATESELPPLPRVKPHNSLPGCRIIYDTGSTRIHLLSQAIEVGMSYLVFADTQ
ncbi:unnamed protein product [Mesocestoides corti]|uniref:Uncharacterized protein n=1 Tax=Mesocestoides corti TaxID=53468 RepID=A0A0R3UNJ7_MESCO|nr:unnamed protein product [Mesocestoides corti]